MTNSVPAAPRHRRVRPGMVETADASGRVWTVEQRRDTWGGGSGWAWFASCDEDRFAAFDPFPTMREAVEAVAVSGV